MKKTRSMLLAVAMMSAALILMLLPLTASAASGASPAESHPSGGPTAAAAPEFNRAEPSGPPPSTVPCAVTTGARACFQAYGDRWWVQDTAPDSASAEARWRNYHSDGSLHRLGVCRNSLGNGNWGVCNKNYNEGTSIQWRACVYDGSRNVLVRCSDPPMARQA